MNLKNILIANIKNIIDFLYNAGAFARYLLIQQFVVLPYLAGINEALYCLAVLFVTIMNILGSVIGDDAGNCYLVRYDEYQQKQISPLPDISRIILLMGIIIGIALGGAAYFFDIGWPLAVGGILCVWLCALRFVFAVYFRKKLQYQCLIKSGLFYCVGMLAGVGLFKLSWHWIGIFLSAEIAALFYNLYAVKTSWNKNELFHKPTDIYKQSWIIYIQLSLTSLLLLAALYLDRFILYKLLSLKDVAVYFAASAMSKVIFMLGNPLYSFLLARFSASEAEKKSKMIRNSIIISLVIFIVCGAGTAVCMLGGMYIFYNAYLQPSLPLFLPLCLASGIGMAIVIHRSLVIKFCKKWMLLLNTVIYTIFILVFGWLLTDHYGSYGMCWAIAAGQFIQSAGLLIILITRR